MELFKFIVSGKYNRYKSNKFLLTFKLVFIGLLVHFAFAVVTTILKYFNLVDFHQHPTTRLIIQTDSVFILSMIFLLTIIVHPTIEELSFRLILKPNKSNSFLGIGFLLVFLTLIFSKLHEKISINNEVAFNSLFIVVGIVVALLIKYVTTRFTFPVNEYLKQNLTKLVFITSILFAISHFYVISEPHYLVLYIPLLLPYVIIGYILSYARLSLGFMYSILCHSLNNLFFYMINLVIS